MKDKKKNPNLEESDTAPLIADRQSAAKIEQSNGLNESSSDFDLSINAVLSKNYSYRENSSFPLVNEVNKWVKENVLIWDSGSNQGKAITINLPKTFTPESELNLSAAEVKPQLVSLAKSNELFPFLEGDEKKQDNLKKDEKPVLFQHVYDDLNSTQISQIWKTGKFTRYCQNGITEEWNIRPWVFQGKERCFEIIKSFYGCARFHFKQLRKRIYSKKVLDSFRHNPQNPWLENAHNWYSGLNILNGIRSIIGVPGHLIFLFFGIEYYTINSAKFDQAVLKVLSSRIEREIFSGNESRYGDISFLKHAKENTDVYDIAQFDINTDEEMLKMTKRIHDGSLVLDLTNRKDKSEVKRILQDYIYENVIENVSNYLRSKDYSQKVISSFEETYRSQIAMDRLNELNFSRFDFVNKKELESIAFDFLKRLKCEKHLALLELIIKQLKQGVSQNEVDKIKKELREIGKTSHAEIQRFFPIVHKAKQADGSFVYSEKPNDVYVISSTYFGWKIVLLVKFSYCFTRTFMNVCINQALYSYSSFKTALYTKRFPTRFTVNPTNGELLSERVYDQTTITEYYRQIKAEANQNIEDFENEPDYGLLGKSLTRICNRLENWVFWHFLYGFLFVNIFLRIACIMISLIFLMLIPLSIMVFPLIFVFLLILTMFLVDLTVPSEDVEWEFPVFLPIFNLLIWRLMIRGVGQIFLSVILLFFHVMFGAMLMMFSFAIYALRRAMDCITFIFIYSCGRVPGGDSYLAYRSYKYSDLLLNRNSQGGQSTGSSNSKLQLKLTQVQRLIDSEFDKRILTEYREQMVLKIKESVRNNDKVMKDFVQDLPFQFESNRATIQYNSAANKLISILDEQVSNRRKVLPFLTRKQTQQFGYDLDEITSLKQSVVEYLQTKYAPNPLFMKVIWKELKVDIGNYELLSLTLFNSIFFNGMETPASVLEKLKHKDAPAQADSINGQIDTFLKAKFNFQAPLKEPLSFFQYRRFISKVLARQDPAQPVINIKKNRLDNYDELILLNAAPLNINGEHKL